MNAISKRCIVCLNKWLCDLHIHTSYEGLVGSRQLPNSPRAWVSEIPQAPGPLHKDTTNVKGRRPGNYNQTSQTFCWNNSTILAHSSSHAVSKKKSIFQWLWIKPKHSSYQLQPNARLSGPREKRAVLVSTAQIIVSFRLTWETWDALCPLSHFFNLAWGRPERASDALLAKLFCKRPGLARVDLLAAWNLLKDPYFPLACAYCTIISPWPLLIAAK